MVVTDNVEGEDISHITMADDGKGASVTIPSFLISMASGNLIKEAISEEWLEIVYEEDLEGGEEPPEGETQEEAEEWKNDDYFYEDEVEYKKGQKVIL